ncbi:hypothetical protein O3P69_020292 [Scylla paramamosain]|uniref:Uncharacterized protein n=1 Tax=Scylla paramamosain TaxID=85552 RepID=A0AAW0SJN1_SCYPA
MDVLSSLPAPAIDSAQRIPNNTNYQIPTRMDSHLAMSNRLLQKQGTASPVHHRRHCYWAAKKIHPSGRYLTTACRRCEPQHVAGRLKITASLSDVAAVFILLMGGAAFCCLLLLLLLLLEYVVGTTCKTEVVDDEFLGIADLSEAQT